jgi:hypothetical protein
MSATHFRLYLMDNCNRPLLALDLLVADKKAAIALARAQLKNRQQVLSYEIWQNARRVQKERNPEWTLAAQEQCQAPRRPASPRLDEASSPLMKARARLAE